jgi:hypothetical protein
VNLASASSSGFGPLKQRFRMLKRDCLLLLAARCLMFVRIVFIGCLLSKLLCLILAMSHFLSAAELIRYGTDLLLAQVALGRVIT